MKNFSVIEELFFGEEVKNNLGMDKNFVLGFAGAYLGAEVSVNSGFGDSVNTIFREEKREESKVYKYYDCTGRGGISFSVEVCYEFFSNSGAVRQTVTLFNNGKEFTVNHLSSAKISGIGNGNKRWYDKTRFVIHTCDFCWQGEAQWRKQTFSDIGLVPTSTHINHKNYSVTSKGSWTTGKHYPIVVIEDKEKNKSFYMELEPAGNWQITLYNPPKESGGFCDNGVIALEANCANINNDGWYITLGGGESYTAQPCVYGYAEGGFEAAAEQLNAYKRETAKAIFKERIPVMYNNYMNSQWGFHTSDNDLIPLIDACSEVGVEIFCIDAGWYDKIGQYNIKDEAFGKYTLQETLDYIRSRGMMAGIWLEMECYEPGEAFKPTENSLLCRNGETLGTTRALYNFREKHVRDYMESHIDKLYGMGVRFIKNDYNRSTGIGVDNYGGNLSKENADSVNAFLDFIDYIREKYKDLIIENCGSGALRADNNTLSRFHLQSTSDQELFYRYPSISSGFAALTPPEKAGVWAYPYPLYYNERNKADSEQLWHEKTERYADGNETAFNMVTGIMGAMYLSGRIDKCDRYNLSLIKEAVAVYKENEEIILRGSPVYPLGTFRIDDEGIFSFGIKHKEKMLLAVWNINSDTKETLIDLSRYYKKSTAKILYPSESKVNLISLESGFKAVFQNVNYSAVLIEISGEGY